MSVNPFPNPKFRAFDSNGDPLAGGKLYTYSAGTTTPLATYTTRAGNVANANPIILDANGEADLWTTPGVDYKFVLKNSADVVQWTVDNIPSPSDESSSTFDAATEPGGRLTLTSMTPVTTSDVTGATTIYYTPHKSDKVPLFDGSAAWASYTIATELSQTTTDTTKSPAAVANNSNYDLFVWDDAGTLRLSRGPAWTGDNTRGTGVGTTQLVQKNGRYVNAVAISSGPGQFLGLYVGTVRSDGSAQINDSVAKRLVWNQYNRVRRNLKAFEATDSWNYTTATFRQANGSTANQIAFIRGLADDMVAARLRATAHNSLGTTLAVAIGLDSTSAKATDSTAGQFITAAGLDATMTAEYFGNPSVGYHFLAWLEYSAASGTTLWLGDNGASIIQSGIVGEVWA